MSPKYASWLSKTTTGVDAAVVYAAGQVVQTVAVFAKMQHQSTAVKGNTSVSMVRPSCVILSWVFSPTPGIFDKGKCCKSRDLLWRDGGLAIGFAPIRGNFGQNLFGAMPAEAVKPCFGQNIGANVASATSQA